MEAVPTVIQLVLGRSTGVGMRVLVLSSLLWLIVIISSPPPLLPLSSSPLFIFNCPVYTPTPFFFYLCDLLLPLCPLLAWLPCCWFLCSHAHYHPFLYFKSQQLPSQVPEHSPVVYGTVESAHLAASTPVTAASDQKQGLCMTCFLPLSLVSCIMTLLSVSPSDPAGYADCCMQIQGRK